METFSILPQYIKRGDVVVLQTEREEETNKRSEESGDGEGEPKWQPWKGVFEAFWGGNQNKCQ